MIIEQLMPDICDSQISGFSLLSQTVTVQTLTGK